MNTKLNQTLLLTLGEQAYVAKTTGPFVKIGWSVALLATIAFLSVGLIEAQTVMGSGTKGTIPLWTSSSRIGNSIMTQVGSDVIGVSGKVNAVSASTTAVEGVSNSATQPAVMGSNNAGDGLSGTSNSGTGVSGTSRSSNGVSGQSTSGDGVAGISHSGVGVKGTSTSTDGVFGTSSTSVGVDGTSTSGLGVSGTSSSNRGVEGNSDTKGGVVGMSTSSDGVVGVACSSCSGAAGITGIGKLAGSFTGNVGIVGNFAVVGVKAFHIDHPLDPANKYLNHFAIESNEVLNTYSGNVITDASGIAIVELPEYFEALNTNYRYQLTVLGQFAQAIILEEIQNNRFVIKTDKATVKVSWQVTGVRSDAYAKAHPVPVEEEKAAQERGYYLAPEVFGQAEEMSISWLYHADVMRDAKAIEAKRRIQGIAAPQ